VDLCADIHNKGTLLQQNFFKAITHIMQIDRMWQIKILLGSEAQVFMGQISLMKHTSVHLL